MPSPQAMSAGRRVARRALLASALSLGGRGLLLGAIGAVVCVGAAKASGFGLSWGVPVGGYTGQGAPGDVASGLHWGWLVGVPAALGLAAGVAIAVAKRWGALAGVLAAEETLSLGSRVSTALTLGAKPGAALGGFERLAIDDGERAASGIDAARVVRLKFGRSWGVAPALLAAAAALGALVPAADWRSSKATISVASTEQRAEAADAIAQAAAAVREVSGGDAPMATTQDLSTLEELERELTEGRADPRAARARAAESVESAASRLERQAQERMEADRALRERLARAGAGAESTGEPGAFNAEGGESPGDEGRGGEGVSPGERPAVSDDSMAHHAAARFARALRDGDLEGARDAVRSMREDIERMTPEERERLARQLEELANGLGEADGRDAEPLPPSGQPEAPRAADQGENSPAEARRTQELQERGLSEGAARDVARETDPEAIRERLEREGVDPPTAEREAREIAQENREREAHQAGEQQARERARDIGESLREAARAIERDEQSRRPEPPSRQQPTPDQPASEQAAPQQPSDPRPGEPRPQQPESRQTQPGQQQPAQQQPVQEQPGQAQPGRQQPAAQRDPVSVESSPSEPGSEQPGSEQSGPPNSQPAPQQPTPQRGQPTPSEQLPTQGQEPGQRPVERTTDRPTEQTGADSGEAQSRGAGTSEPVPERDEPNESDVDETGRDASPRDIDRALDALERNLDRAGDLRRRAAEDLDDAQRLRDAADRLLERTTPEQRERLWRLQRELAERQRVAQRSPSAEPTRFESVDASRPDDSAREQVISEWLGEPGEMTADPAARREALGARVREAAAGAERAVEAQEVPSRYNEFIRRVFRRYGERAGEPLRAEDAPDARP